MIRETLPEKDPTKVKKWCCKMANWDGQISSEGIEVFISYSHEDKDLRDKLEKHLSVLKNRKLISAWNDKKIGAGEEWKKKIDEHLNSARIILLLISSDFFASEYCEIEMTRAMERHDSREARVIPIILWDVLWESSPIAKLQVLPTNAKPVTHECWRSIDEAFKDVAKGLEKVIGDLNLKKYDSSNSILKPMILPGYLKGV